MTEPPMNWFVAMHHARTYARMNRLRYRVYGKRGPWGWRYYVTNSRVPRDYVTRGRVPRA